jgi:hypothetical protein
MQTLGFQSKHQVANINHEFEIECRRYLFDVYLIDINLFLIIDFLSSASRAQLFPIGCMVKSL